MCSLLKLVACSPSKAKVDVVILGVLPLFKMDIIHEIIPVIQILSEVLHTSGMWWAKLVLFKGVVG